MVRTPLLTLIFPLLIAWASPAAADGIDEYVNAYYLAEGKMTDFDKELDQAFQRGKSGILQRSKSYRDLIALRIILDEKARAIAKELEKLDRNSPELELFRARLDALDPVERIAVTDLLPELRKVPLELPTFFSTLNEERAARAAALALMASRTAAARRDDSLNAQVRVLASTLDFGHTSSEPVPLTIQPGAGSGGTISGANFPANTWALTYDDGPSDKYTPLVLANLQEYKKKASFMWLVECLEQFPELARQAKALGLPTNNHSWTHENLDKAKPDVLAKEVVASSEKDTQFYGEMPHFFRLPYGAGLNNKSVRQLIADNGMIHVFWNVDSLDWQDKSPDSILARVKKEMAVEKHGIILFHDIHPQSVEASKLVLKYSATLDGTPGALRWVTIPEIVDELNHRRESMRGMDSSYSTGSRLARRGGSFSLDRSHKVR